MTIAIEAVKVSMRVPNEQDTSARSPAVAQPDRAHQAVVPRAEGQGNGGKAAI